MPPAAADHHRLAAQLRIAQQLDRRVERVHVEVGDDAYGTHAIGSLPAASLQCSAAGLWSASDARLTEDQVLDSCRDRIVGYKRPRSVSFIREDEMPRTATGKILHRRLRDRYTGLVALQFTSRTMVYLTMPGAKPRSSSFTS